MLAIKKHGSRFDYSMSDYKHSQLAIQIGCRKHNLIFEQLPNAHLRGWSGCVKCKADAIAALHTGTTASFIQAAMDKHGDTYDYSKVDYEHSGKKVIVICRHHGQFRQTPSGHLAGSGCKKCNLLGGLNEADFSRHPEKKYLPATLYLLEMREASGSFAKIGITTKTVKQRYAYRKQFGHLTINELRTISGSQYEVWKAEQTIKLTHCKMNFVPMIPFGGDTECFQLSVVPEILAYMDRLEKSWSTNIRQKSSAPVR